MTDINFEQLQKEIQEAEVYLRGDGASTNLVQGTQLLTDRTSQSSPQEQNSSPQESLQFQAQTDNQSAATRAHGTTAWTTAGQIKEILVEHDDAGQIHRDNPPGNVPTNKYSDPIEREQLINRLLGEHNRRVSSQEASQQSSEFIMAERNVRYDGESADADDAGDDDDARLGQTIFFASDLHLGASQDSGAYTPTATGDSFIFRGTIDSSTIPYAETGAEQGTTPPMTAATAEDISLMSTVRFTKAVDPNVRYFTVSDNAAPRSTGNSAGGSAADTSAAATVYTPESQHQPSIRTGYLKAASASASGNASDSGGKDDTRNAWSAPQRNDPRSSSWAEMDDNEYATAMFAPESPEFAEDESKQRFRGSNEYHTDPIISSEGPNDHQDQLRFSTEQQEAHDPLNQTTMLSNPTRHTPSGASSAMESVHRRSSSRLRSREAVQKQAEEEFKKTHSFRPKLYTRHSSNNNSSHNSSSNRRRSDASGDGLGSGRGGKPAVRSRSLSAERGQRTTRTTVRPTTAASTSATATEPRRTVLTYAELSQQQQQQEQQQQPQQQLLKQQQASRNSGAQEVQVPSRPSSARIRRIEELHRSNQSRLHDRALQRQEQEKLELEQCTFKPKIAPGSKRILRQKAELEQLDDDIDFYRTTGELPTPVSQRKAPPIKTAHDRRTQQTRCVSAGTARPPPGATAVNVNENTRSEVAGGDGSASKPAGTASVSDRLYHEAEEKAAQMRWMRQQVEEARAAQYTFQPCLNPFSAGKGPSNTGSATGAGGGGAPSQDDSRVPLHERLADVQRERKEYLHALRASVEEEQMRKLPFQPQLAPRSRKLAEKRRYFGSAKKDYYHPIPNAFLSQKQQQQQPQSDGQHLRISGEREAEIVLEFDADVGSRLTSQGRVMARRKQMLQHEHDVQVAESMAPAPISSGSQKILNRKGIENVSFQERQELFDRKQRKKALDQQLDAEYEQSQWFKPALSEKSVKIVSEQRPELLIESDQMRAERLSQRDAEAIEARRRQKAAEIYGTITFTPEIDPLSKALARASTVEELATNVRGQTVREQARQRLEEERNRECTYQPKINELSKQLLQGAEDDYAAYARKYYAEFAQVGWGECGLHNMAGQPEHGSSNSSVGSNMSRFHRINMKEPEKMARDIRIHLLEKEEARRSELVAREIDELRDCTFHPSIERSMTGLERLQQATAPVVVRGLGRHLELAHLREKQRVEAALREKEVFSVPNVDKFRRAEDGSTIVQEFEFRSANLSKSTHSHRADCGRGYVGSVGVGLGAGRAAAATTVNSSVEGSPELQRDYLALPTSHRNKHSTSASSVWCY